MTLFRTSQPIGWSTVGYGPWKSQTQFACNSLDHEYLRFSAPFAHDQLDFYFYKYSGTSPAPTATVRLYDNNSTSDIWGSTVHGSTTVATSVAGGWQNGQITYTSRNPGEILWLRIQNNDAPTKILTLARDTPINPLFSRVATGVVDNSAYLGGSRISSTRIDGAGPHHILIKLTNSTSGETTGWIGNPYATFSQAGGGSGEVAWRGIQVQFPWDCLVNPFYFGNMDDTHDKVAITRDDDWSTELYTLTFGTPSQGLAKYRKTTFIEGDFGDNFAVKFEKDTAYRILQHWNTGSFTQYTAIMGNGTDSNITGCVPDWMKGYVSGSALNSMTLEATKTMPIAFMFEDIEVVE